MVLSDIHKTLYIEQARNRIERTVYVFLQWKTQNFNSSLWRNIASEPHGLAGGGHGNGGDDHEDEVISTAAADDADAIKVATNTDIKQPRRHNWPWNES